MTQSKEVSCLENPELYNRYKVACIDRGEIPYCYGSWVKNLVRPLIDRLEKAFFEGKKMKVSNDTE